MFTDSTYECSTNICTKWLKFFSKTINKDGDTDVPIKASFNKNHNFGLSKTGWVIFGILNGESFKNRKKINKNQILKFIDRNQQLEI